MMIKQDASLPRRLALVCLPLVALLVLAVGAGLLVGSSAVSPAETLRAIFGREGADPTVAAIVWKLRLPRTLVSALAGGTLALCGLVFQAVVRNPLADPYILGVSGGAALGAVAGILLQLPGVLGVGPLAFAGALAAFAAVVALSLQGGRIASASLVLSGVMVNAFCSAAIMLFVSMARGHTLHTTLVWLMGDTSTADLDAARALALCLLPGSALIFALSHKMNLLLLGGEAAANLGVRVGRVKTVLVLAAVVMTAAVVSQTGLLGFVGLVCPHILRLTLGHDQRLLVPGSVLFGACFLVCCDLGARLLSLQGVMPVGVLTALIGAPLFLFLLHRSRP